MLCFETNTDHWLDFIVLLSPSKTVKQGPQISKVKFLEEEKNIFLKTPLSAIRIS